MPRHSSTETFQLDLRSSPSQLRLHPSRSSSLSTSQRDEMEASNEHRLAGQQAKHKLDLYSIPVFLLELLVLAALGYAAYFTHFQYQHQPFITGFYCDDISYRQRFVETKTSKLFANREVELTFLSLLMLVPIVVLIFSELVNSMFGALKFRQIRALCTCCKLHSITRRTIRFAAAYLLGFLIVVISCDVLASTTGRLRPYFAQECPAAYQVCLEPVGSRLQTLERPLMSEAALSSGEMLAPVGPNLSPPLVHQPANIMSAPTDSAPRAAPAPQPAALFMQEPSPASQALPEGSRIRPAATLAIPERRWVDISNQQLSSICSMAFSDPENQPRYQQLAMSWPSFPAAIVTFACLYLACYLSFVGTARPVRIITCILVLCLAIIATIFNTVLVKDHYHHWDDTLAGAVLALVVLLFILYVYLNKFRDTHYYENQKLIGSANRNNRSLGNENMAISHHGDIAMGQFSPDKTNHSNQDDAIVNADTGISSNDLAMRYFQIPRANFRGVPRNIS